MLMGACFIGVPAACDPAASIVMPQIGMFGDEVTITIVSGTGFLSSPLGLLFMNEEGVVVGRTPVTAVSSTTVYASFSKLDIEPGMYTLSLDIGVEEPLLLDASFIVQPPPMQAPSSYTITAYAEHGGVMDPVGEIMVEANGTQKFVIVPDLGYVISSVIIDGERISTASQYTFDLVRDDHTITAQFGVEIPDAPEGKVSVITDSDPHTQISPSGSLFVERGTPFTFTIKALPGSTYTSLRINGEEVAPKKMLRITADTDYLIQSRGYYVDEHGEEESEQTEVITQPEEDIVYTFVSRADIGGTIEPLGELSIMEGSNQVFLIVPKPGYHVKAVLVDGIGVGGIAEYNFENVQESHTIRALFEREED
jgi:hypothetical protein